MTAASGLALRQAMRTTLALCLLAFGVTPIAGEGSVLAAEQDAPDARWGHMLVHFPPTNEFVLYGGASERGTYRDDMWAWDGKAWSPLDIVTPPARGFAAVAYDPERNAILLHGGRGNGQRTFGDLWAWEGGQWQLLDTNSPIRSDHHRMAHLPGEGGVLLYGGWNGEAVSGETWHWNEQWTLVADVKDSPPPRSAFAMAWNPLRQRVELYGGLWINGQYADSWAWREGAWKRLSGPYDNSSLDHHSMFFDSARNELLIFGGKDYRYTMRGETRRLGSDGLVETITDSGPSPRHSFAVASDPARGLAVLFGGKKYEGEAQLPLGDTWVWKGGAWHPVHPPGGPEPRGKLR